MLTPPPRHPVLLQFPSVAGDRQGESVTLNTLREECQSLALEKALDAALEEVRHKKAQKEGNKNR